MKKNKILILIVFVIGLIVYFHSCDYRLWMLKSKELTFNELPIEVQTYLKNIEEHYSDDLHCVNYQDTAIYRMETIWSSICSSWIGHFELINKKKNICYRIPQHKRNPIIFKNKLYIADKFILYGGEFVLEAIYTEYELK